MKREVRRKQAAEARAQRLDDERAANDAGIGIEAVDFLNLLAAYRRGHGVDTTNTPWAVEAARRWASARDASRISVFVRKRPMLQFELKARDFDVIDMLEGEVDAATSIKAHRSLVVHEPRTRVDLGKAIDSHAFRFDAVFSAADGNEAIHAATVAPLLPHVLDGGHATVFAFGQTGSGKTLTMQGHGDGSLADGNGFGLYALSAREMVASARTRGLDVFISFFEVYRGQVYDLLAGGARRVVLEDGKGAVHLAHLAEEGVSSADELLTHVGSAARLRAVGCTSANETSSRSHAVLQIVLRDRSARACGTLRLVDLAGSERASDSSSSDRQTRIEGAEINKSLLALKECMRSLDSGNGHIPFRASKLTHVLRDAFVGRAKMCMIATVAPGGGAAEQTLNTLRYAQHVTSIELRKDELKPPPRPPPPSYPAPEVPPPPLPMLPCGPGYPRGPQAQRGGRQPTTLCETKGW